MKKIYIFIPFLSFGGVQELGYKLALGFKSRNIDVVILSLNSNGLYKNKFKNDNIEIIAADNFINSFVFLSKLLFLPFNSKILFLPSYYSSIIGFLLLFRFDLNLYYTFDRRISSYLNSSFYGKIYFYSIRILSRFAKGFIFSYRTAYDDFTKLSFSSRVNYKVIYHPVSNIFFNKKINKEYMYDLLYAGRFEHEKGLDIFIEALFILKEKYELMPETAILGNGSLFNSLSSKVKKYSLGNVRLFGYVENVDEYMDKSKILVLPSLNEGCSGVVKEAIVKGLPSIVTDVDTNGPQEMIGFGLFGEISDPGNPSDLAEKIKISLNKRYDIDYQKSFAKKLTLDYSIRQYEEFIFEE